MKTILCGLALGCLVWATPSQAEPVRGAATLCYLWADQDQHALNQPYVPNTTFSFNAVSTAAGNTVTHVGTGRYAVKCAGAGGGPAFSGGGGHVQVSSYGFTNTFCHVEDWETGDTPDFFANVVCFGRGGGNGGGPAPQDSKFVLLFVW
jgi:hypothetical protein